MSVEEQKAAEANVTDIHGDVVSETNSDSTSQELPPFRKRNRRMECVYISVAVLLGASLIGVLVYFSVTNALNANPEPVSNSAKASGGMEMDTTTEFFTTTGAGPSEMSDITRPNPFDNDMEGARRTNNLLRNFDNNQGPIVLEATTAPTTTEAVPDFSDKGTFLRSGEPNPFLRRGRVMPPPPATDATEGDASSTKAATTAPTTTEAVPDFSDKGTFLRSGEPNPFLRRGRVMPPPPATDATEGDASSTKAGTEEAVN